MLATPGQPRSGASLAVEFKWDGFRGVAVADRAGVDLFSRTLRTVTGQFGEAATELHERLGGRSAILDGELVAFDALGRPSFARMQQREVDSVPVTYLVFDVLSLDGRSTTGVPYEQRRARLAELDLAGTRVQTPDFWPEADPEQMLAIAGAHGFEGIVCKKLDSVYQPGRRSPDWIKTPLRRTTEVIVLGWEHQETDRDSMRSLRVGAYDGEGELVYLGRVGTGWTVATKVSMLARLIATEQPRPAATLPRLDSRFVRWVAPRLVGEVEYRELTDDDRLRQPAWKGFREDKTPDEVRRPDPAP